MKKQLLTADLGLTLATSAQAADRIAIANIGSLFQQVAQRTGVSSTLENEFRGRASELQRIKTDLQVKMKRLQSMKTGSGRTKLEKDVMTQHRAFVQKMQTFEQDRARRSNEERGKLATRIQTTVKSIANSQGIGLVVDANTIAYNSSDVKDTTVDILKQVKQVVPSIQLADLTQQLDAGLHGGGDIVVTGVASMQSAQTGHITFMVNPKYRGHLDLCQTSAVVMTQDDLPFARSAALVAKNPYLAYAHMAQILDATPKPARNIVPNAVIDETAKLGSNVSTGTSVVTESGVRLSNSVIVGAGYFVGKNSKAGAGSRLWTNVTIYHEIQISQSYLVQSGTVIDTDGFGYTNDHGSWVEVPQTGRVITDDRVEIGACTTIDHGALNDAIVGNGVIVDSQCQVVHNVVISDNTTVAGGVVMAGSLKTGRYYMIDGAGIISRHMEICDKVTVTGMGMAVCPVIEPGVYSSGIPLQPDEAWCKTAALVMNIDDMSKRLKSLERKVN